MHKEVTPRDRVRGTKRLSKSNKAPTKNKLISLGVLNPEDYVNNHTTNIKVECSCCKTPYITSLKVFKRNIKLCKTCIYIKRGFNKRVNKSVLIKQGCLNPEDYINNNIINLNFKCSMCSNILTTCWGNLPIHSGKCVTCVNHNYTTLYGIKQPELVKMGCLNPNEYKGAAEYNLQFPCSTCSQRYTTSYHIQKNRSTLCIACSNLKYGTFIKYYDKPTLIYYIKINNLYKVGITTKDVATRFNLDDVNIEIIDTLLCTTGLEAYTIEQYILNRYSKYSYSGKDILKSGNTELFTKDILSGTLDKYRKEFNEK